MALVESIAGNRFVCVFSVTFCSALYIFKKMYRGNYVKTKQLYLHYFKQVIHIF